MHPQDKVSTIMTLHLITVKPKDTLGVVRDIFDQHKIHHLPVVENDKLVGILSKSDFYKVQHCFALFRSGRHDRFNEGILHAVRVEEVMTREPVFLTPEDTLSEAAKALQSNQFHALPVINHGKLVGLVTTYDLIRHAYSG